MTAKADQVIITMVHIRMTIRADNVPYTRDYVT